MTPYERFKSIVTITIPLIALAVVLTFIASPEIVDNLSKEDNWVENLSAAALFIASAVMVLLAFRKIGRKAPLLMAAALAAGFVFFIIGMEEISWGQRVLEIESSEFFREHNMQSEMNLHNLHSHLSEILYYTGAFLFLVLIPFFRDQAKKLLIWMKLGKLKPLLPSTWLVIPFSIIVGFVKTNAYDVTVFSVLPLIITPIILLTILLKQSKKYSPLALLSTGIAFLTVCLSAILFSLYDYDANGIRNWFATEWKELFIALGLMVYAVDLWVRPKVDK